MLDYDTTMRIGEDEYRPVLDELARSGWPASFAQTGGMCAALHVPMEGGVCRLLITDAEDTLSWSRSEQEGWGVGFYADPERYPDQPDLDVALAFRSTPESGVEALLRLISEVAREGTLELGRRLRR